MPAPRPFALIRTHDQWLRASHDSTALRGEVVQLYWRDENAESFDDDEGFSQRGAGLVFDSHCRLYHSVPAEGRVERLLWAAQDPLQPSSGTPSPVDLIETDVETTVGEFEISGEKPAPLLEPHGLAVDEDDRLFVAESGAKRILIYDLWSKRLVRRVQLGATPLDLATDGRAVFALLASPPGLVKLDARAGPQPLSWPGEITDPSRIAISADGELYILEAAGSAQARIVRYREPGDTLETGFATDMEFQTGDPLLAQSCGDADHALVVARRPGEDFLRFCAGLSKLSEWAELPPLKARAYDGLGITLAPDGRIGFWTKNGFRHAVAARLRYLPQGSVITYRLDSGEFHTVWGRVFLDACIPKDTDITVRCITADEPPEDAEIARGHPVNTNAVPPHADLSPPMPPQSLADQLERAPAQALQLLVGDPDLITAQRLHRRETGRELPWVRPVENDPFETYEAPVIADPGRYLWARVELSGNTRTTPRLRALRVEYPTHDYLRRIPQTFSRDERASSFLRRYLAIFEGALGELEAKADARRALLDPRSAPAEILPWLAGFLGLTFDERMARAPRAGGGVEDVRRALIAEATWLFRFRGSVMGLRRFLQIYLGAQPILIEKFRVRGLGGALLGESPGLAANSVLGAGFRVGGAIGADETQILDGEVEDSFATHAHRFAVIIPASLTTEQSDVVAQILELHRPAHTLVEVCTVGAGMRIGRGLHVALTSIIGRSGGFTQLQLGGSLLGHGSILGKPEPGTVIGGGRLGRDSRIG
jgi:phage tail-like protein